MKMIPTSQSVLSAERQATQVITNVGRRTPRRGTADHYI